MIRFAPFRLDIADERLWRDQEVVPLRRRSFAVLRYLAERPGRLVTKSELLDALWTNTHVSDVAVKGCIAELRRVLGEDPKKPRIIETLHGRGYRFIADIEKAPLAAEEHTRPRRDGPTPPAAPAPRLVGRDWELRQLDGYLQAALEGRRQIVFTTGEAGIGKTALVEAFLERVARGESSAASPTAPVWIARGQCLDQYGSAEPFMPILDALTRLCLQPTGERVRTVLSRVAPLWLLQLPAVTSEADRESLRQDTAGMSLDRMLRTMAKGLEALTQDTPLILVLEDLHWSDHATVDLISCVAQRLEPARLLLLCTCRPVDLIVRGHPLRAVKQQLRLRQRCIELPLQLLDSAAVTAYVEAHLPEMAMPEAFGAWLYRQTDGNPLFVVNLVDYLATQGLLSDGHWDVRPGLRDVGVPDDLRQLIEQEADQLPAEQRSVLEVASVVGMRFCAAAVAAAMGADLLDAERCCDDLARQGQFIVRRGTAEWPDGTVTASYVFVHELYRDALYNRTAPARRVAFHRQIAQRMQAAYGGQADTIAVEMALHFERGREYHHAAHYLGEAAKHAIRRSSYHEAIGYVARAIAMLPALPDEGERARRELTLRLALGASLVAIEGNAHPEVADAFIRAKEVAEQLGDAAQQLSALWGLWGLHIETAQYPTAREVAAQALGLAKQLSEPEALARAHRGIAATHFWTGEFTQARDHLKQSLRHLKADQYAACATTYGPDTHQGLGALTLWFLGYPDAAAREMREALERAERHSSPYGVASTLLVAGILHYLRREPRQVAQAAAEVKAVCIDWEIDRWMPLALALSGWAAAETGEVRGGLSDLQDGIARAVAMGSVGLRSIMAEILIEVLLKAGETEAARLAHAEALRHVENRGERLAEAEIHRLGGELSLQTAGTTARAKDAAIAEAEDCFRRAIDVARRQHAKSFELRAVLALSRLRQTQGREREARRMLAKIYGAFTEGLQTADLRAAAALLKELKP